MAIHGSFHDATLPSETTPVKVLAPGTEIGNEYVIEAPISTGGMGAVYRARRLRDDALVAVKQPLEQRNALRFQIEARLLARLRHPRVVRVLDHIASDQYGGLLVMDLVRGPTLASVLERTGPLPPGAGRRVRDPGLRGAGVHPRAADRPSRRQAGEPDRGRRRNRLGRLRHRARRPVRQPAADRQPGHAAVRGTRGAGRRRGFSSQRRLRAGRDAVGAGLRVSPAVLGARLLGRAGAWRFVAIWIRRWRWLWSPIRI